MLLWGSLFITRNKDGLFFRVFNSYESHTKILWANVLIVPSFLYAFHAYKLYTDEEYVVSYNKRIGRKIT
jgi:hypothetical protein